MPYLSCKKIENDVYNFPTWQYCKYKDIFDSRIIINSTAKFYISISYHKDLLSIDTRIFTPSNSTPWWFENNLLTRIVSCSVRSPVSRPSPKLASSRLRQRLFGAAASQTSRRKPCYRQSDLFSNSSWLYYFTHYFLRYHSFAHCQKLLAWPLSPKQKASANHKYLLSIPSFYIV